MTPVSADKFIIYDSEDTTDDKSITLGQIKVFCETDISGKQDLITSPTNNNVVTTDALGQTKDSGIASTNLTTQGNTFNGASQLVQLNSEGKLPAISGINLTELPPDTIIQLGNLNSSGITQLTDKHEHIAVVSANRTITPPTITTDANYAFMYFTTTNTSYPTFDIDGWGYSTTQPPFSTTTTNFVKLHKDPITNTWHGEYIPLEV
jgi:hypothetical protein